MIQSGPETCTSSTCPAAEWETALSLYSVRLKTIPNISPATVHKRQKLLNDLFYLYGWAGLLATDPHLTAARHYHYLSEKRQREPARILINLIEGFRYWYNETPTKYD